MYYLFINTYGYYHGSTYKDKLFGLLFCFGNMMRFFKIFDMDLIQDSSIIFTI